MGWNHQGLAELKHPHGMVWKPGEGEMLGDSVFISYIYIYISYSIWSKIWNLYTNMSRYIHILCVSMCASRVWNVCFRFNPLAVVDFHSFSAATNSVQTQFGETFHQEGCQRLHSTLQKPQKWTTFEEKKFQTRIFMYLERSQQPEDHHGSHARCLAAFLESMHCFLYFG